MLYLNKISCGRVISDVVDVVITDVVNAVITDVALQSE
jgi:hypothetical protein